MEGWERESVHGGGLGSGTDYARAIGSRDIDDRGVALVSETRVARSG